MKIVVTGGSGAFGQFVVTELVNGGHEVLSLDRSPPPNGHKPAWLVDLLQPGDLYQALAGAGAVVHLAGHNAPGRASDTATFNDNVRLTFNVLNAAADIGVSRIVVASSIGAYGFLYAREDRTPDYLPLDEDHPCRPTDPYGLSKIIGETICESFAQRCGLSIASLRLPGINYDMSYRRIEAFMKTPGERRRGFWTYVDARDAAAAVSLCIEKPVTGHRVFNIAAPRSNMREPTLSLLKRFYPDLKDVRGGDEANWSCLSSARAKRELGFSAQYGWETHLKPEAYEMRSST